MRNFMTNTRFMLLWSLGSIASLFGGAIIGFLMFMAGSFAAVAVWGTEAGAPSPTEAFIFLSILFSAIGLAIGLVYGGIQKAILRMRTDEPWRGWLISSAIGGVIGVDIVATLVIAQGAGYFMWSVLPPTETLFWIGFQAAVVFFGCLGLAQIFALWQYVYGAWVWILANIVAGVVLFSLVAFGALTWVTTPFLTILMIFFIAAAPGIVTGFALVWLINGNWRQSY